MFKMLFKVARFLKPRRKIFITSLIFSLLGAVFQAMPVGALYLLLLYRTHLSDIVWTLVWIVAIGIIGQLFCRAITQVFLAPLGFQLCADERVKIGDRLKAAPMGYFNRERLGDVTSAVTTTMLDAEMYMVFMFEKVLSALISYLMLAIFLLVLDWRIGLVSLVVLGISLGFVNWANRAAAIHMPRRQETQRSVVTQVMEFLGGAALLRSFNCESIVSGHLYRSFRKSSQLGFRAEMTMVPPSLGYLLSLKWGTLLIAGCGVGLYLGGMASLSLALMMMVASFVMVAPLESLIADLSILRMTTASLDLIEPVQNAPVLTADTELAATEPEASADAPAIAFDHVSFSYEDRPTLVDVSASLPAGSTTALIGPSGSGKTTLCNLMMRFWDVDSGRVRVQGRDVRAWEPDELLANFAVVFQNVYLFSDTVATNIRFGRPDATMEEVREAARRARCLDFIEALPDGFDTVLAEGGASLSGGEKQRISIARAILKDAPLVILDEATSSVDPENERELQLALDELCREKTRIVIAHNMSTVRDADQILVFNEGRIVQRGRHSELAETDGIYRDFIQIRSEAAGWRIAH